MPDRKYDQHAAMSLPPRICRGRSCMLARGMPHGREPALHKSTVAIIGGGPHALAILSALHERSLASPQFKDDAAYALRVGFDSYKLVGTVAVIDPGTKFCDMWNKRFQTLEIERLRSPLFAHPDAYDDHALLNFAIRTGRTAEITHPDGAEISRDKIQRSNLGLGFTLHGKPSASLFKDFCTHLGTKHPHEWVQSQATGVEKDPATGKYRVVCGEDHVVVADAVVIATGPQGKWKVPASFQPFIGTPGVLHTSELFETNTTLLQAITRRTALLGHNRRVLVIGAGLTAVQAALAALRAGLQVSLRSREAFRTRDYDVQTEWLDRRHTNRLRFKFLSTPLDERLQFLREALGGGSVPSSYLEELREFAAANSDCLDLRVEPEIEQVVVEEAGEDGGLTVDGERFELVILATGVSLDPSSTPLFQQIRRNFPASFVGGFPELDASLRWSEDENMFVVGCNAGLELGPGALNLMGAMRGARLVAEELHELMWKDTQVNRSKLNNNLFSMLEVDGCSSSELEDDEVDDEPGSDDNSAAAD